MDYNHTQLSIYDIGRINFQVKKMLLGVNILGSILSDTSIEKSVIHHSSSAVIVTKEPTNLQTIKFMVKTVLLNTIMGMQSQIMSAIDSLGYTNPNAFYEAIINRIDMLYTVLQISEKEFSIILI